MKNIRKYIVSAALLAVLSLSAFAQSTQRSAATVVGDALHQFPATSMVKADQLATELLSTGREGLDLLNSMFVRQDDSMVSVEYALTALVAKATEVGGEQKALVADLLKGYADAAQDATVKQYYVRQLMVLGVNYENKNTTVVSELDNGTAPLSVKEFAKVMKTGDRKAIFDALYRIEDASAAVPAVISALKSASGDETVADLVWWLGEQKYDGATDMLSQYLASPNAAIREEAAWALVKSGDKNAASLIATMLEGDESNVQVALECLKSCAGDVAGVVAPHYGNVSAAGQKAIVNLLGQRNAVIWKDIVYDALFSEDAALSKAAAEALPNVVENSDIIKLYTLLESSSPAESEAYRTAILSALSNKTDGEKYDLLVARKSIVPASQEYLYWPMVLKVASPSQILAICEANADNGELVGSAISAYLKTVYEGTFADAQKLLWYRAIMDYAQTDAQKVAILQKVGTTSAFQGIFFAAEYLDDPATQQAAAIALRRIVISNPSYYGPEITALMQRIRTISTGRDFIYDQQLIDTYLEKAHDDEGYVSLFDGETLAGWQGMVGDGNPYYRYGLSAEKLAREQSEANLRMAANWVARDGEIQYVGTGFDNLCSAKKYADFEMYVDWKIYPGQPDGDAGIYLRSSPQVQIWDTARTWVGAEVGSGGLYNNQLTESKPLMVADNPVGEWNTFYIKMVGERVTVWLNGQLVTDQIVMENYWDRSQPILPEEFIELQAHGSKIGYRNIHIHEFPTPVYAELSDEEKAEGFELLFDGRTLEKWQGNKVDYNVVAGEIAVESRSRGGSWIGDLYTVDEFADFVFRFEFKLTKGANNGVGVRAPGTGDAAYEGCEIQILDHFDDIYQPWLKDYQYHGSVYGIIPADWSEDVFRPVGEWNSEEIYMKGSYVRVTLNGKVITEGDLNEASKDGTIDGKEHPGLARTSGHIGFLGHGDNLWLRNIRVKRL